jgi:hydrogenase maturation protein HypF
MSQPPTLKPAARRWAIAVRGIVQGVGFRPFVYNAATSRGLVGWVQNEADTVRIEIQGVSADLDAFLHALRHSPPPQARIDALEVSELPCQNGSPGVFEIRLSPASGTPRPTIPADLATCSECLQEICTAGERRHRYPFTNCTNCGPRWSIIQRLPYDRPRTSMAMFQMCPACQAEYRNPADRRFHAQPIACPQCGPMLQLLDHDGTEITREDEALECSVAAIRAGQILALKGLGGFQLIVDATSPQAVARLRERKQRVDKPFAVMMPSLDEIRRRCEVSDEEARALASAQAPILLLRRKTDGTSDIAEAVAPGNPYLGVMLPYTPLHHLLMAELHRPVVCTSGNLSEEPMAITPEGALERLGSIADALLVHDRPIVRPVDDSVARVGPDGLQVLRRARGFAPLPVDLGRRGPTILAVGGHLKNTVALSLDGQVVLSPHIGDLDNVLSVDVYQRAIADLIDFFHVVPAAIACDLHPDYASTRHAESLAAGWGVPLVRVQHHHAHVAACMAEHRLDGPVLGFSWDGTGYGTDGTVWGGEVLECEGANFRRYAHLRTFSLPGGDRAAREPRRSALGLLFEVFGDEAGQYARFQAASCRPGSEFGDSELGVLLSVLKRSVQCPRTSSMGRLFDAVAALCGLPAVISFEGQAAMALEFAASDDREDAYPLPVSDGTPAVIDWEPLVRAVIDDRAAGVPVARISARFHSSLAEMAVAIARRWGGRKVVLTGGCFQNTLLTRQVRQRLLDAGFQVYLHHQVPPGDGGIALGQVFVAARELEKTSSTSPSGRGSG